MTSDKTSADELTKADYERLSAFRYVLRRFLAFSAAAAETAGLTAQQHQALLTIKGFPGREEVTIGELAERLTLRHHSTVGLVDRLALRGLVNRRSDPDDRRAVLVSLTPEATTLLAKLSRAHREELAHLSPTLIGLLEELVAPVTAK
ncbi:MAG TPA: MarR family transcriptional regulator [Alphaproteobacteria bacterium]|nr:MarR family transcriptional regulator [Alphaproteobacteria bacterium]